MLNPDYRDIVSAFANAEVEYLLVGAYALAAHGYPRATGDIDLWVRPTGENAARVMRALRQFGAPLTDVSPDDFARPDVVFQIGATPRRVDVITSVDAVTFTEAWPERMEVELEGVAVPVIGRAHLIQNKRASGRAKDRADAEHLEAQTEEDE